MPILENKGNTLIESNATQFAAISIITKGRSANLEFLSYAQSQSLTTSGVALDSGWIPIGAETKNGITTVVIKNTQYSDPNGYPKDLSPSFQAIDYDPITGKYVGIHGTGGRYFTRDDQAKAYKEGNDSTTITPYVYFGGSTELEFLNRFGWVIDPNNGSSVETTGPLISAPSQYGRTNADVIMNYNPKSDSAIRVSLSDFNEAIGRLQIAKKSKQVAKIAKSEVNFIYDQQAGYLYYNQNGSQPGFGNGGLFAILDGRPKVTSNDFDFV